MALTTCPTCNGSSRVGSKIPSNIMRECHRNGHGKCEGCTKLTKLDKKIEETLRNLHGLLVEREATASLLNECHDPFIKTLPNEVVARIFEYSLPLPHKSNHPDYFLDQRIPALHTLGLVSKQWSKMSLGTPSLWTYITVEVSSTDCLYAVNMVKMSLDHSGGLPLHLRLSVPSDETIERDSSVGHSLQKIAACLGAHAARWKTADISLPPESARQISHHLANRPMPRLDRLSVSLHEVDIDEDGKILLNFKASPRSLELNCWLMNVNVQYEKLRSFSCGSTMTTAECVQLLRDAPQLLECRLEDVIDEEDLTGPGIPHPYPINHSHLRYLSTGYRDGLWPLAVFPSLTSVNLPSLRDALPVFQDFLVRSRCKIQEITFGFVEAGDCLAILKQLPGLASISLHTSQSSILFSLLDSEVTADPSNFLANLVSINCSVGRPRSADWPAVIKFLHTISTRSASKFKKFDLELPMDTGEQIERHTPTEEDLVLLLRVTRSLDISIVGHHGTDVLDKLRRYHGL